MVTTFYSTLPHLNRCFDHVPELSRRLRPNRGSAVVSTNLATVSRISSNVPDSRMLRLPANSLT